MNSPNVELLFYENENDGGEWTTNTLQVFTKCIKQNIAIGGTANPERNAEARDRSTTGRFIDASNRSSYRKCVSSQAAQWESSFSRVSSCLPSFASSFVQHVTDWNALEWLAALSSHLVSVFLRRLSPFPLPFYSSFSRCLLYLTQIADSASQCCLLARNPFLTEATYLQLVADLRPPVARLLRFLRDLAYWSFQEGAAPSTAPWELGKDVLSAVVVLQKFLAAEGSQGDAIWRRNIGMTRSLGLVREVAMQLRLADALLAAQLRQTRETREMQPEVRDRVASALQTLQSAEQSAMARVEQLEEKLRTLQSAMESDGMEGVPAMRVEGDVAASEASSLSCVDNSELWSAIYALKG